MNEPLSTVEGGNSVERAVYAAFIAKNGRLRAIWRFLLAIIVVLLANIAAGVLASPAGRGRLFDLIFRTLALFFMLVGFSMLLKLADGVAGNPLPAMGLSLRKPWIRDAAWGALLGFFLILIAYIVIRLTCDLTVKITLSGRTGMLVIEELVILASAAMLEEAAFRGYPFQRLVEMFEGAASFVTGRRLGAETAEHSSQAFAAGAAAIVWSLAFGAAHLWNPSATIWSFLNTTLVGVLLCIAYLRTRSLWMPWGIHFAWNTCLGLLFGLPVSGVMQFAVMVRSKIKGPGWITGGDYGIEGSALGTAVIIVGMVLVLVFVKQRQYAAVPADPTATLDGTRSDGIQS